MSARVYLVKTLNDIYKDLSICGCKMNSEDGQVYSVSLQ